MNCPRCHATNIVGAAFCSACGQPLAVGNAPTVGTGPGAFAPPGPPPGAFAPPGPPPGAFAPPGPPPIYVAQPIPMGPQKTSGMAIAGFVLSFLFSLLGLIFSIIGYNECKKSGGTIGGQGLALAGIIISIFMMLVAIAMVA